MDQQQPRLLIVVGVDLLNGVAQRVEEGEVQFLEVMVISFLFCVFAVSGASSGRCDAQSNTEWSRNVSNAVGAEKTS